MGGLVLNPNGTDYCIGNGQTDQLDLSDKVGALNCMHDQQAIMRGGCNVDSVVRRLTPLECERLQGMPDDWSKYGTDENGNVFELSDSARYKIQGNGICTPFWRWMMKRISAQYERQATLGSLFDGQASFPMIWEEINGEGSAVWSSEIDKNAAAVARYHFPDLTQHISTDC